MAVARATSSYQSAAASPGDPSRLSHLIETSGFAVVDATTMRGLLGVDALEALADRNVREASPAAKAFGDSWNDLPLDEYMGDGGRYRRRRHAVFTADEAGLTRQPHQPHYQSRHDNPLNGGIVRWFGPVLPDIGEGPTLRSAIRLVVSVANGIRRARGRWRVEAHQFRIEARAGEAGRPTPEGMHCDGVDFVLIMLVGLANAAGGVTTIADPAGTPLVEVRLTTPFEAMLLDDHRVRHGVSPVEPVDPECPAIRDALVVTLAAV
jgi:hypothetical protein